MLECYFVNREVKYVCVENALSLFRFLYFREYIFPLSDEAKEKKKQKNFGNSKKKKKSTQIGHLSGRNLK